MAAPKVTDFIKRALNKSKKPERTEWKHFSQEKIDFLQDLADPLTDGNSIINHDNIFNFCFEDKLYVKQCLLVSLESETKFWVFFPILEELIVFNELMVVKNQFDSLKFIYLETFLALIDTNNMDTLAKIMTELENKNDEIYVNIHNYLETNSPILISACRKDHFDQVRILVSHGQRLQLSAYNLDFRIKDHNSWPIPNFFNENESKLNHEFNLFEAEEMDDILLLRLMAKPSYILARYDYAYKKTFVSNEIPSCNCQDIAIVHHSPTRYFKEKTEKHHFCPGHPYFEPDLKCKDHVECNDPILQCLQLTEMATKYAKQEHGLYREECEEITKVCSQLSVQFLNHCNNTNEVHILLKESAGCSKVLQYTKEMGYPRLRMAIEHNLKEFVVHMHCQEMFQQKWHGNVSWYGRHITYKILYFFIEIILAPLFVAVALVIEMGRSFQVIGDNNEKSKIGWISKRSQDVTHNLDVPLNRFLIFTGYYFIFIGFLLLIIFDRLNDNWTPDHGPTEFHIGYFVLSVYNVSILYQTIVNSRYIRTYFSFWKVFDMFMHLLLFVTLTCKIVRTEFYSYEDLKVCINTSDLEPFSENFCSSSGKWYYNCTKITEPECQILCETRKTLDDIDGVLLAIVATLSLIRLLYWIQLKEFYGPVIMNMVQSIMACLSICGIFAIIIISFTFGLIFVMASEDYAQRMPAEQNCTNYLTNYTAYYNSYSKTFQILFWSILDPQNKDEELKIDHHNMRGIAATILVAAYQLIIIIVLLNLLIAVMNATIQKVEDQKLLYWKFIRTSTWIEFFDPVNAIPIPFSIFMVPGHIFHQFLKIIEYCRRLYNNVHDPTVLLWLMPCDIKPIQIKERETYAKLMVEIIQRYNGQPIFQKE